MENVPVDVKVEPQVKVEVAEAAEPVIEASDSASAGEEPVQDVVPDKAYSIMAVRATTDFEQRARKLQVVFSEARDRVMAELKDDIKDPNNFVVFVIKAMQAIYGTCGVKLRGFERHALIVDLVKDIVHCMPLADEVKDALKDQCFPMIDDLIRAFSAAAKGYLYLCHSKHQPAAPAARPRRFNRRRDVVEPVESIPTGPVVAASIDVETLVDEVYHTLKTVIRKKEVSLINIVMIGTTTMQIIEEYPQLAGFQKKMICLNVMHRLVDEIPNLDDRSREALRVAINTTLNMAINFIIKASRGEVQFINDIVESIRGCCGRKQPTVE